MAGYVIVLILGIAAGLWLGRWWGEHRAVRALARAEEHKLRKAVKDHRGRW